MELWSDFLKKLSAEYELSPTERDVFLKQFADENFGKRKREQDMADTLQMDVRAYKKQKSAIYEKFSKTAKNPEGCDFRSQGPGKLRELEDWLKTKYRNWLAARSSISSSLSATGVENPRLRKEAIHACPYRGLFAFREENAEFFFGREAFTKKLVAAVRKKPLVAVIGRSGSGKSSVVFAGLIPQLRQEKGYLIADFSPKNRPFYRLAEALISLLEPQMSKTERMVETQTLAEAFQQGNLVLQKVVESILQENPSAQRLLLVVDQFEELYTLCQATEERQHFLDQLLEMVGAAHQKRTPNFTLVITLRDDFLGQALSYRPFVDALQHNDLKLGPMNRQELQEAIEKPADKLKVKVEECVTERILDAVIEEPGNLPSLEFALTQLWAKQIDGILTHDAYKEIGGVEKALAGHADKVYDELTEKQQQRAQRVFIQLVRPGEGTDDTRRLATRAEVGEDNWDLVIDLADARLVVTGRDEATGEETVEVVHEALIRGWERLRLWVEADRKFRSWQERLRTAMHTWENSRWDEGALLRGALLVEAESWMEQRADAISSAEKEFAQASREHQEQEQQRERELRRQAELSEIDALNSLSQAQLLLHNQLGALVNAVKAGRKLKQTEAPSEDVKHRTVEGLRQAVYGVVRELNRFHGHSDIVLGVSFSPNGQMLASASRDKTVKLWSLDGTLLKTFQGHKSDVLAVSFSPDGQLLASASEDKTVKLWSLDGTLLNTLQGHKNFVLVINFSPNGQMLASASRDKTIKLWSRDGTLLKTLEGHNNWVFDVSFSPDGQILASASRDKTIKLWRLDGTLLKTLQRHKKSVLAVSFSLDAQLLASASLDKTFIPWRLGSNSSKTYTCDGIHTYHSAGVSAVSFSPDSKLLASASWDDTVQLFNLDGTWSRTPVWYGNGVLGMSFSPDSKILASANYDGTVRLWSLDGTEPQSFLGHSDLLKGVSFSPDGKTIASASADNTVKLWNRDGTLLKTLQGHSNGVNSVSFSPDGKTIASASWDKTVKLWNSNGTLLKTFQGHMEGVYSVSFSPDGRTIASASADNTVKLWSHDGTLLKTLHGHSKVVFAVSFSPDGKTIASASADNTFKLWGHDGTLLKTLQEHSEGICSVSFSPDSQMLVSASRDRTVKLWSLDGTLLKTMKGHSYAVNSVSFSPNGKTIVSASDDRTMKLWSLNGTELQTFRGHSYGVNSVSFSPDGKLIASASDYRTVILWNLDLDDLIVRGCERLRDYLKTNPNVSESDRHLCDGIGTLN